MLINLVAERVDGGAVLTFFHSSLSTICRRALQEAVYQSTSEGYFNCALIYDLHVAYGAGGIFRYITVFRARRYLLGLKGGLRGN